jgi:hypothetical protein
MDLSFVAPIVQSLAQKYPVVLTALMFMGMCRLAFKPIFQIGMRYLELEPNPAKRERVQALMNSRGFKTFAFAVDLLFSVKLPYLAGSVGERVQAAVQKQAEEDKSVETPKA